MLLKLGSTGDDVVKLQQKLGLSSELMTCVDKRNGYFNNKKVKKVN